MNLIALRRKKKAKETKRVKKSCKLYLIVTLCLSEFSVHCQRDRK